LLKGPHEAWFYSLKTQVLEKQKKYAEAIKVHKEQISFVTENSSKLGWDAETLKNVINESKSQILKLQKLAKK